MVRSSSPEQLVQEPPKPEPPAAFAIQRGVIRFPEPSAADIFLDLEGDAFVGEHGLEYLFGYVTEEAPGQFIHHHDWALTRAEEKQAFERFVDFVMERWERHPDLHIYHYAPYEPGALKRVMGRYATREEEIDRMLRAGLFVDLYQIVRHSLRASVESYSIKRLEDFFGFERQTPLSEANSALARLELHLELGDTPAITDEMKSVVLAYNSEDCRSALALRNWLEDLRIQQLAKGAEIPRPVPGDGKAGQPKPGSMGMSSNDLMPLLRASTWMRACSRTRL